VAGASGFDRLITFDVGGTSADIAIVEGGRPELSKEEHIGEFPVIMPVVGVSSIGAGGGSIARIDSAGVLKVGPRSAGAYPGPACYGQGGDQPTLTDAYLVCGLVDADDFLGGRMRLDRAGAERAIGTLAPALGLDLPHTAEAVLRVAAANMYAEFVNVLSSRGVDPREYALVAFGGAGPVQACDLALEVRIPTVVIPPSPGTLCALGALHADVRGDYVTTVNRRLNAAAPAELRGAYERLVQQAEEWLRTDAPRADAHQLLWSADMRYVGQAYEIEVSIQPEWLEGTDLRELAAVFHTAHQRIYAHADEQAPVEIINVRVTALAALPRPPLAQSHRVRTGPARAATCRVFRRGQWVDAAVYQRANLQPGDCLRGPSLVHQPDSTVFVPPGFEGRIDEQGAIIIQEQPVAN
jgi:N-methylhydantoinase A